MKFNWPCPSRRSNPSCIESNPKSPALELRTSTGHPPSQYRNSKLTYGSGMIRLRGILQTKLKSRATASSVMINGPIAPKEKTAWAGCPNCSRDLGVKPIGSKPPYIYCPFCGVPLTHVWWQRILVSALSLILAYGLPALLGMRGVMTLVFVGLLCWYPALVVAIILIFKTIPPKYVRKSEAVMTLFQR
jgi:hypothetical protein